MSDKLLSVVVPTKNRYYYLKYLVAYFNDIKDNSIELIIQDNSDELDERPDFLKYLQKLQDSRIIYNYVEEQLSVVENSDRALLKATGEYVTFLGDDDIFSKYIVPFVKEIKEKNIEAVLPEKSSYSWPDIKSRLYGNKLSGKFTQTKITGYVHEVNAKSVLEKVIELGGTDIINLPRVYHAIVKRSVLNKIYQETNSYFPGPSPDIANAVAICKFIETFISIDIPFLISGHSSKSAGGQGAAGKHFGEIKNIAHLPKDTADNWTAEVPFYWSGFTIYAESVIQALKRLKLDHLLQNFNYNYLYAKCLVYDADFRDRIEDTIRVSSSKNLKISKIKINLFFVKFWYSRIVYHLNSNMKYVFKKNNSKSVFKRENSYDVAVLNDEMIELYLKGNERFLKIEE